MYLKKFVFISIITLLFSCSTSSNDNSSTAYSNITISNSSVALDNDYYSSHPPGSVTVSKCTWYDSGKYFKVNGYVVNNNVVDKLAGIIISFQSKPTASGVYTIGSANTFGSATNLSVSQCRITINRALSAYSTLSIGQPVNVTVNNGVVSVDINNLTFSNNETTSSAIITGTIIEGK